MTTQPLNTRVDVASAGNYSTPQLNERASISAPSVRGSEAASIAQSLLNTIGLGANVVARSRADQAALAGKQKAAQDAADMTAGSSDVLSGNAQVTGTQAYLQGVSKVQTQASLAQDTDELSHGAEQFISNHDPAGLQDYLQQEHAKRWTGADDYTSSMVSAHYQELDATLTKQLRDQAKIDTSAHDAANLSLIAEEAHTQAAVKGAPFNFYGAIDEGARATFGANANDVEFGILQQLMAKTHDPTIIDNMPATLANGVPTLKVHPKYMKAVLAMRDEAAAYKSQDDKNTAQAAEFHDTARLTDGITSGRYPSDAQIEKLGKQYSWSAEQMLSWHNKRDAAIKAAGEAQSSQAAYSNSFLQGRGQEMRTSGSEADFRKAFDAHVEGAIAKISDPQQRLMFTLQQTAANGVAYRTLANTLNNPNMDDAKALAANAATVRMIQASPYASTLSQYVTDEKSALLYTTINTLQDLGYDPSVRLKAAQQIKSADRASAWVESSIRKDALKDIDNLPIDGGKVSSVGNYQFAQAEARRIVEALGVSGNFDSADALLKATGETMKSRYFKADGNLYMRNADTPSNAEDVLKWFRAEKLPAVLKDHPGVLTDDVYLAPDGRSQSDRNSYVLQHKQSIITVDDPTTGEPLRFSLSGPQSLAAEFNVYTQNGPTRAARNKYDNALKWQTSSGKQIDAALPSVASYMDDRKHLSPAQRAQLDSKYVSKAQLQLTDATTKADEYLRAVSAPPGANIKSEMVRMEKKKRAEAKQWQDFLQVIQR